MNFIAFSNRQERIGAQKRSANEAMKMEVRIGDRVELREVSHVSADTLAFDHKKIPVLYPGEKLEWVFGSTIPVIKREDDETTNT